MNRAQTYRELANALDKLQEMYEWRQLCTFEKLAGEGSTMVSWSVGTAVPGYGAIQAGVCKRLNQGRLLNDLIDGAIADQEEIVRKLESLVQR